ncbi:MAG: hypothetical protein PHW63_03740 [Alphaproteobacteria bacterium]|nr:hypothetical protein [Alphaproteobacteria bacterium]
MTEKYPQYDDFDLTRVRVYVLYDDASRSYSLDEIEQHYSDISIFQALQSRLNAVWPSLSTTSERELNHLEKYVKSVIDTKFKNKLKRAIADYYLARGISDNYEFETNSYSIRPVDHFHFVENRYGIYLKLENEYGLYSFYHLDDGTTHERFCRSDETFQKEEILDDLNVDEII